MEVLEDEVVAAPMILSMEKEGLVESDLRGGIDGLSCG